MIKDTLLVEIGTEELPPKALRKLATAFADNFKAGLDKAELTYDELNWFAAPRRLALEVKGLDAQQADKIVEKKGPSVQAAFDAEGNPSKAAEGWARSNGITVDQAERLKTDKGEWLLFKAEVKGAPLSELAAATVADALAKLPIPKPMRWGNKDTQFIRPVHTVTLMYGDKVLPGEVLGVASSNTLRGHRFHTSELVTLTHATHYLAQMQDAYVMADFEARRNKIKEQVQKIEAELDAVADFDDELLDEVTSLVEWPVSLVAGFEEKFLDVPAEALIYTMKDDQKYFPLKDKQGNLLAKFIFVSNIESKDPAQVIAGNEKVVRPRLSDAEFFFNTDRKTRLEDRVESLGTVLFQKDLGTLKEKVERISALAGKIAHNLGADKAQAERAGLLSKSDLMSEMVMEFPEVQGVMGMHYARFDGEDEAVAVALNEQYMPRFAGDNLPSSQIAAALALADKFDTLTGIFGIGQAPKGDKDPFALRRAAIGVLRILVEQELPLDIAELTAWAKEGFGDKLSNDKVIEDVVEFIFARFRSWYQEQGVQVDSIQAVLARKPTQPSDFDQRLKAVQAFRKLEAADALAAANKRVGNILAKFDGDLAAEVDTGLLQEDAEKALAQTLAATKAELSSVFAVKDYQTALDTLSNLRPQVDNFFDQVMVMTDDEAVKVNRLTLLSELRSLFLNVADISLLQQ